MESPTTQNPTAQADEQRRSREHEERKQRVLTQGTSSVARSIADAVAIKHKDVFFVCQPDGDVPRADGHGLGLYYHDCRYLDGYELRLAEQPLEPLVATTRDGATAILELTNRDLRMVNEEVVKKQSISLCWERQVDGDELLLQDRLIFRNFGQSPIEIPLSLRFDASFEDIYSVRGMLAEQPGRRLPPCVEGGVLVFAYRGQDELFRGARISLSTRAHTVEGTTARLTLRLAPDESTAIVVSIKLRESRDEATPDAYTPPDTGALAACLEGATEAWFQEGMSIRSDSPLLNEILRRSLIDLYALRTELEGQEFFSAGVPWFVALFGRDSLLAALQALPYAPRLAASTLRLLARYQADETDRWRDEQPGKILHELRVGELARTGQVPHTPYYGTVDATPLFLILLSEHAAWTGDLSLFEELRGNVARALRWMDEHGALREGGYLAYQSTSERGLVNQGWKDSGDAIVNTDGSSAEPPIALVEAQGYAYLAKRRIAALFERSGEPRTAARLREEAAALRARFNRDFWLEDVEFYALALQRGGRPAAVISSNSGHTLWAGIADDERAHRVAKRLMAEDMFSGWGIRTLSAKEGAYHPISYHRGTVWPHDNAIIAAGLRRYGCDEAALRIFSGLVEAAMHFEGYQLPELFCGFERRRYGVPVRYPVACHPQAWAAGAILSLLQTVLGLVPEGLERRLRVVRPLLPPPAEWLELRDLRVGEARVSLRFERASNRIALVRLLERQGQLEVLVDPGLEG